MWHPRSARVLFTILSAVLPAVAQGPSPADASPGWNPGRPAPLPGVWSGEPILVDRILAGTARARSAVAVDLDADGASDLVVLHAGPEGGILALRRGNLAAIFPNSPIPEVREALAVAGLAPFHREVRLVPSPVAADLLAAGDFDADGKADVVTAARGDGAIWLHPGDGRGGLEPPRRIPVPGAVTALAAGDLDRFDGVTGLAVAVDGKEGASVRIYGSPRGALAAPPAVSAVPAPVTSLAVARADDDSATDVVAVSGGRLVIVPGASEAPAPPGSEPASRTAEPVELPYDVAAVTPGHFLDRSLHRHDLAVATARGEIRLLRTGGGSGGAGLVVTDDVAVDLPPAGDGGDTALPPALLAANASPRSGDDLVVVDGRGKRLVVTSSGTRLGAVELEGSPVAAVPMRLGPDGLDDLVFVQDGEGSPGVAMSTPLATFTVNTTGDLPDALPGDGICLDAAGTCSLRAAIQESNATAGGDTIDFGLGAGTPTIVPGSALPSIVDTVFILGDTGGSTRIEIAGHLAGAVQGLTVDADSCILRSLVINRFTFSGILINSGRNRVENCYLGTDSAGGTTVAGNGQMGVNLNAVAAQAGNTIGGAIPARNVISKNGSNGVRVSRSHNSVEGNYIGTDPGGTKAQGNGFAGVYLDSLGTGNNRVGGTVAAPGTPAGNLISGNQEGIRIQSDDNFVQGNLIGTDASGLLGLPNGTGIVVEGGAQRNLIGGALQGLRNVVSANSGPGVIVFTAGTEENAIEGNLIGTDVTGGTALGNGNVGVDFDGVARNRVGGPATPAGAPPGNVISGNSFGGVIVRNAGADFSVVQGNLIGTDLTGGAAIPNGGPGVWVDSAPMETQIGGDRGTGEGNVISGNGSDGIRIQGAMTTRNRVYGNLIGADVSELFAIPNAGNGVRIGGDAFLNEIGGSAGVVVGDCKGHCNVIAANTLAGVFVLGPGSNRNPIRFNKIVANTDLGIDLDPPGVTPNDPLDADLGANDLQNFPSIQSATFDGVNTTVEVSLRSTPATNFAIDLYANNNPDPSGHGEGRLWLGTANCVSNAAGDCPPTFVPVPGQPIWLTATATAMPAQDTSEFSGAFINPDEASPAQDMHADKGAGTAVNVTYTPACGAIDHAVYGGKWPFPGAPNWTDSACGLGTSGMAVFDPGVLLPGEMVYFVIVGNGSTREGSYGPDSNGAERPEAVAVGLCDLAQALTNTCP